MNYPVDSLGGGKAFAEVALAAFIEDPGDFESGQVRLPRGDMGVVAKSADCGVVRNASERRCVGAGGGSNGSVIAPL